MKDLRFKLTERILKDKSLLQEQLKKLLVNGRNEEIVLGEHISKETVTSFLEDLSNANTVKEITNVFSSGYELFFSLGPCCSYWLFSTIAHNIDLLTDTVSHLGNVEHWKNERTYAEEEKRRVEKEIADLEEQRINLEKDAESLRKQIEKALQEE